MSTRDKDKGYERIKRELKNAERIRLDVGIMGGEKYPDADITVAEIAIVHEFGSPSRNIPERSFLRSTIDENKARHRKLLIGAYMTIVLGQATAARALSAFGMNVVGDIQRKITTLKRPPLKPATIAAKNGKANPLIDTGTMRSRVKSRIRRV